MSNELQRPKSGLCAGSRTGREHHPEADEVVRVGARPKVEREAVPAVWFAGRWRSPEAVERKRQFYRERQRQRRREGTGR